MTEFFIGYIDKKGFGDREVIIRADNQYQAIQKFTIKFGMLEITDVFEAV